MSLHSETSQVWDALCKSELSTAPSSTHGEKTDFFLMLLGSLPTHPSEPPSLSTLAKELPDMFLTWWNGHSSMLAIDKPNAAASWWENPASYPECRGSNSSLLTLQQRQEEHEQGDARSPCWIWDLPMESSAVPPRHSFPTAILLLRFPPD